MVEGSGWTKMDPATPPPGRGEHGMAYDAESDRVILFGGWTGASNDETWAYDFNTDSWTNMAPSVRPSARSAHPAMVYDSESDRIILFGGYVSGYGGSDETWAYDFNSNTWTSMSPATRPPALSSHNMAYDSESDRVILFGGLDKDRERRDETWAYDFNTNTWSKMTPTTGPSPRAVHGMAYDSESDRIILFGGYTGEYDDETWAYDFNNNTWTSMNPLTKPSPRVTYTLAYDSASDRVILFGGATEDGRDDETWAYDYNTNTWTNLEPATRPASRYWHQMAYDSESERVVLFGGYCGTPGGCDDTWAYKYSPAGPSPPPEIHLISPFNYAAVPPGTPIVLSLSGAAPLNVTYSVNGGPAQPLEVPYITTDSWSEGTYFVQIEVVDANGLHTSLTVVLFVDSDARWPMDTVPVDVVLIGFEVLPSELESGLVSFYNVSVPLTPDSPDAHTFSLEFQFNVSAAGPSYQQDLEDYLQAKASFTDSLQARLNLTALIDQRDNGTHRDIFDPLVGWEIRTEWAELYLEQFPPVASVNDAGYTFYLMNLSGLDEPPSGVDHWFVEPTPDPDTLVDQDWWRLEWDNDPNTPMGYPLNIWGGDGHRLYVDPTAYQWYLDWTYVWWAGGNARAPYGLQYEEIPPGSRVDYLAGIVNDLVKGLAASLPWGPPEEAGIEVRNYVLSGSLNHSLDALRWVSSDIALQAYFERFLPFKAWELNTTFALVEEYPELMEAVDSNTTFDGDQGFIDGLAVWTYLFENSELYVPDDPGVFEILTVSLLYDNRSMVFGTREFTGLGGSGITAIFLKTDRLFYGDGTRQKGLTSIISHETGHNLGYGHQFGPHYRSDFVDGTMGYFRNDLEYGRFWEDALHRVYVRERLLRLLELLNEREPLDLAPEFLTFYQHYRDLDFLPAYEDLVGIEAMLTDPVPPVAEAGPDLTVNEDTIVRLDGSASTDNFRILNYTWDFGDGTTFASSDPAVDRKWEDPGVYTVALTVYDAAGNSAVDTLVVSVSDTTLPVLSILSPSPDALLASSEIHVTWTASDDGLGIDRFEVKLDRSAPIVLDRSASSHMFTNVEDGPHLITVTTFDQANNSRSLSVTVTTDTTAPILSLLSPPPDAIIVSNSVEITWRALDAVSGVESFEIGLDGRSFVVLDRDASSYTFANLEDGLHNITLTAFDSAGNAETVFVAFTVDTNPLSPRGPYGAAPLISVGVAILGTALAVVIMALRRRRQEPPAT